MKKIFLLFFISNILFAQEYYIYKLKGGINLDGKLDEEIWNKIPTATGFKITGTKIYAKRQTYFKAFYDDENIYLGIICKEPEMDKIIASSKDKGAASLWEEDSIEIFFQPDKETNYYQFIINAMGSRWCGKYLGKGQGRVDFGYDWNVGSYKNKDYYSLEVIIPFKIINKKPVKGEKWRVNISRNILTNPEERLTSWPNFKVIDFHELEEFGYFIFNEDLNYSEIEKIEEEINKDYILYKKIYKKKLTEEFLGYEKEVKELLKKPKFKNEIGPIAEKMDEIKKVSRERINLKELEKIEDLAQMIEKLKEIKSRALIEELFE